MTSSSMLPRFASQPMLYAGRPARSGLWDTVFPAPAGLRSFRVNVWQNHAFEPIAPLLAPFAAFGGCRFEWRMGSPDDTLSFAEHDPADLELVWLDRRRQPGLTSSEDHDAWLDSRMRGLRARSPVPIVVVTWTDEEHPYLPALDDLPDVYVADLAPLAREAGLPLVDERTAAVAGTCVRASLHTIVARTLAGHWLGAALLPPLKAVALDLDDTLHAGVLAEDGPAGVVLSPGHVTLHHLLRRLRRDGVLLALVTRNEARDVEQLFAQRADYPLRLEDFSATDFGWQDKSRGLLRIADQLNIGADAILFVDDNWGELAAALQQAAAGHTVWAQPDAALTARAIEYYPGLWRWRRSPEAGLRHRDVRARRERAALLASAPDVAAYRQALQVSLRFRIDPLAQRQRLAELCQKTNQFNLSLRRSNEADIEARLRKGRASVVSVELGDALSASGVIATVVGVRRGADLNIEELAISCRALQRSLEDTIVLEAIRLMPAFAGCRRVVFDYVAGPRNEPAMRWLATLLGRAVPLAPGCYALASERVRDSAPPDWVNLQRD